VKRGNKKVRLFHSRAKYYEPAGAVSWDVSMEATPKDWRVQLKKGDVVSVTGTYDSKRAAWYESMAIMPIAIDPAGRGGVDPFAHPDKVHRLDYKGEYYRSRGPFTVPRSEQGHPVVIQAGQSDRGRRFAARWGELIFVHYRSLEAGQKSYAELKDACAAQGRDPDSMKITTLMYKQITERKR